MLGPITLDAIVEVTGGALVDGPQMVGASGEEAVTSVSSDTRTLQPGALFVALKGENFDGHHYLAQAEKAGANALMVERTVENTLLPYVVVNDATHALGDVARCVRDDFTGPVVGVTGSVGKTTTKELLALVLDAQFNVLKSEANHNNEIGVPQTLFNLTHHHSAAVIEMGMRGPKQIARLAEIANPTIGVVTGVGLSHIELLGSREAIADAKAELLQHLPAEGVAVFPAADPFAQTLRDKTKAKILTVGVDLPVGMEADVKATDLTQTAMGWQFTAQTPWGAQQMEIPSPGKFNVQNALLAVAVAGYLGIGLSSIADALRQWSPPAMRLQILPTEKGATVISDAYNAAPDSVTGALQALRDTPARNGGKKIAVLGEMRELGSYAVEGYRLVGRAVAEIAPDMLVLIGQAAQAIGASARVAGFPQANIHVFDTTQDAVQVVPAIVQTGDVVLVKGSRALGMEQIVNAMGAQTA